MIVISCVYVCIAAARCEIEIAVAYKPPPNSGQDDGWLHSMVFCNLRQGWTIYVYMICEPGLKFQKALLHGSNLVNG